MDKLREGKDFASLVHPVFPAPYRQPSVWWVLQKQLSRSNNHRQVGGKGTGPPKGQDKGCVLYAIGQEWSVDALLHADLLINGGF